MRKIFLLSSFLFTALCLKAQYKNDNVTYKTVDPAELCSLLRDNPGYLLLDVRSAGEHNDTSRFTGLNIGHLKNARNIDIRELPKRWKEIENYKQKPVFVYCSHSQRSRRASRLLADSGFTNIFNINGGLTSFYYRDLTSDECIASLLSSANGYSVISPAGLCKKMTGAGTDVIVLDVRPDSAYGHISTDPQANASGTIRNSLHIPFEKLQTNLSAVPKNKEVIVIDVYGDDAAKAAALLSANGYTHVSMLIEGIERFLYVPDADIPCKSKLYVPASAINTISVADFGKMMQAGNNHLVIDARSASEFESKHRDAFRNIGRVTNAVNVPSTDIDAKLQDLTANHSTPVYIYDFSGGKEAYTVAAALVNKGFTNVSVIGGGLFNIRWTGANMKGQNSLFQLVTDVPEINR
jgi:rhodanese-related sulfurtransferase